MKEEIQEWLNIENSNGWKFREASIKKYKEEWFNDITRFMIDTSILEFKQGLYNYLNNIIEHPRCEGNNKYVFINNIKGYSDLCVDKCSICKAGIYERIKQNNIAKWGVSNPMQLDSVKELQRNNNKDKYGVENTFQRNDIKEKIKNTYIEKHGVEHHTKTIESKEKKVKTNLEKHGVEHVSQSPIVRKKIEDTNLKKFGFKTNLQNENVKEQIINTNLVKYGVKYISQLEEVKQKVKDTNIKRYGNKTWAGSDTSYQHTLLRLQERYLNIISYDGNEVNVTCQIPNCLCNGSYKCSIFLYKQRINVYKVEPCIFANPIKIEQSSYEVDVFNFITSVYNNEVQTNNRSILNGKEIDIFISEHNLGIEFNGVYWHSELHKEKNYHKEKTLLANKHNINLFHIWEDDWLNKMSIVKSMICSKLKLSKNIIGARKCQIKEVSSKESKKFLEQNHLQGNVNSSVRLGLYHNDELVSLMTSGKLRKTLNQKHIHNEYELYRYANKLNTNVQGGFSRLLNYFVQQYSPSKIHTYANADHSNGNVYIKNGFEYVTTTSPGYHWVVDGIRRHRFNYRKDLLVKSGEDSSKTEAEIMHERGHYRIWDSGNIKLILNI